MSRKYNVYLEFSANVIIEAETPEDAASKGRDLLDARSVYEDDVVEKWIDEAYLAGLESREHPLKEQGRKAYELRDQDFNSDNDPEVVEEVEE